MFANVAYRATVYIKLGINSAKRKSKKSRQKEAGSAIVYTGISMMADYNDE